MEPQVNPESKKLQRPGLVQSTLGESRNQAWEILFSNHRNGARSRTLLLILVEYSFQVQAPTERNGVAPPRKRPVGRFREIRRIRRYS